MATYSKETLDKIFLGEFPDDVTLSACSGSSRDKDYTEVSYRPVILSDVIPDKESGGEWICLTDLLRMGAFKRRPRLLPEDFKTYMFLAYKKTDSEDLSDEEERTLNPKLETPIHPKKRLLKHFLEAQECS